MSVLSFFRRAAGQDAMPPSEAYPPGVIPICRALLIRASALSYDQRLLAAHRVAAEVRARKPHMRITRVTPRRDKDGRIIL